MMVRYFAARRGGIVHHNSNYQDVVYRLTLFAALISLYIFFFFLS